MLKFLNLNLEVNQVIAKKIYELEDFNMFNLSFKKIILKIPKIKFKKYKYKNWAHFNQK